MSTEITQQSDRFVITADGTEAGFAQFVDRDGRRIFHHTEIREEFGGRGLGGELAAEALRATGDEGRTVVTVCPFVASYVERHPELADNAVKPVPDDLAAVPSS